MELQGNGGFGEFKPKMMLLSCFHPPGICPEPVLGWDFLLCPHTTWSSPTQGGNSPFAQGRAQVPVTYLKPDGIDHLTEHKEGQDPESTENGGEDELQPGPDVTM